MAKANKAIKARSQNDEPPAEITFALSESDRALYKAIPKPIVDNQRGRALSPADVAQRVFRSWLRQTAP